MNSEFILISMYFLPLLLLILLFEFLKLDDQYALNHSKVDTYYLQKNDDSYES